MTKDLENHKNVLVIGGGVTGIQATKDLAERGYQVYLVEKEPNLGGKLVQLDETFPVSAVSDSCSLCYPLCYMLPELSTLYLKKNIKILTYSTVKNIEEKKGKYNVLINSKSRFIDVEKCNGCEKCIEVCPVKEIPDEFNFNISKRTAIYQPLPGSITPQHLIDQKNCKNFIDGSCKKCAEICPQKAINFKLKDKEMKINVDSIIVATGFDQIDPSIVPRYGSKYQNVVTSLQFERLNSINGPTKGQVLRLSNNKAPKSIAFIQCVCSREKDTPGCVSYCSTVCCMYAAKEALTIRKKKLPEAKCSIFNTEQRGYGKQYYDMMIDAKHNYDVNFINGRVGKIKENPESNNLIIYYENINTGEFSTEEYEMVVLASGLKKSEGKERISQMLGSLLDEDGLFPDTELEKLEKRNIYIAGFARYPMNIPDSVSDGSSVAAKIAEKLPLPLLKYEPDEEVENEKQKTASQIAQQTPKIGVIYCEFQSKISSIINFEKIIKEINGIPDIISQEIIHNAFSKEGRKKIQDIIQKSKINRVVFSAGSPRYYEEYFKELLKEIKFNPSLMDIVDIREQNAYVHQNNPEGAIQKAIDLIKLSIVKVRNYQPLITVKGSVIQSVLVIGSEISGIIAASSLAKQGIDVHLLETTLENLSNSFEFDKISHSAQISNSQLKDIVKNYKNNKDITIHSNIKLVKSSGFAGNYSISLEDVNTKEIKEMKFGAIIVAGGTKQHPPANGQFEYGVNNSVMTQQELELAIKNKKLPKISSAAIILCANQRLDSEAEYIKNYSKIAEETLITSNCSNICCTRAISNAKVLIEANNGANIAILYRDLQLTGGKVEEIFRESKKDILYMRYDPAGIINTKTNDKQINISFKEINTNTDISMDVDLLIVASPISVDEQTTQLSKILKIRTEQYGYFMEEHSKVEPLNSTRKGIYICGSSQWPNKLDIEISQALGAAMKAGNFLAKGYYEGNAEIAYVDVDKCIGCGTCIKNCPYVAINFDISIKNYVFGDRKIRKADINPLVCQSCGICLSECPVNAISMNNWSDKSYFAVIEQFTGKITEGK